MDIYEKICERLELGEPLSTICKGKDFPEVSSVYKKCRADAKLQNKIISYQNLNKMKKQRIVKQ